MSSSERVYDVIVVGAGHAGCEAALACARLGFETLVLCLNLDTVAAMSCNPAIGGLAKGQLVREIDALGGAMGLAADACGIQFKMLNTSKGPAVQAPRAQCDKFQYRLWMKQLLERTPRLHLRQAQVERLLVDRCSSTVYGVRTTHGIEFRGRKVILTTGTFLQGLMHIGSKQIPGGRSGETSVVGLSASLAELGFELGRLKTGTNPRVDKNTIDFKYLSEFHGDIEPRPFSFRTPRGSLKNKVICWTTQTNEAVHDAIRSSMERSPLYNGTIKGIGPRYCPSIEDKIMRFPEKTWHQVIVEPEGLYTNELYLNGLSTSLPEEDQIKFLRKIRGFENVEIMRPGYAVEYDFVIPTQLNPTLESKIIHGLYFAGQINGTSGYEEAAAQGLIAGINASLSLSGKDPLILGRHQAYIGVLIDDLVTKGTMEPYRLFTSLAEYRLLLRQDNADLRLTEIGYACGLIEKDVYEKFVQKRSMIEELRIKLDKTIIFPNPYINKILRELESSEIDSSISISTLLRRPEISFDNISKIFKEFDFNSFPIDVKEQVEIQIKYDGYIKNQIDQVNEFKKLEDKILPKDINYFEIYGISKEAREKLSKYRPISIGQASRISGVTPADINVLIVFFNNYFKDKKFSISTHNLKS